MHRQSLPLAPAKQTVQPSRQESHIVNVFRVPTHITKRELRKVIGRATYHIQRDPLIRFDVEVGRDNDRSIGKITFAKAVYAQKWLDVYGERFSLYPIMLGGNRLGFAKSHEWVDPYQLQAIQLSVNEEDNDSDYDEEGDGEDHSKVLNLSSIQCGAFDDEDRFCVGWSKTATTRASAVSFDIDDARLRIRCENLVIQASIYDIKWIFHTGKPAHVYFEFKHPPVFLQDVDGKASPDSIAWLETAPPSFNRQHEQYRRVSSFDAEHSACVQYGTIYRVQPTWAEKELISFFKSTNGRLRLRAKVSEVKTGPGSVFDCSAVDKMLKKLDYGVAFQAQALLGPHRLLPNELFALQGELTALQKSLGSKRAASVVRNLRTHLCTRGPLARLEKWPSFPLKLIRAYLSRATPAHFSPSARVNVREKTMIHSAFLTPSFGVRLDGPHPDDGNRILRSFADQDDSFIRIQFSEEDGSTFRVVQDYGSIDSEEMMHGRFGDALRHGITIAGRKFHFLAFSGSSLREHSCWFVRNFKVGEDKIKASTIRAKIGILDHIRSPARYAARMGQAFTATSTSILVHADSVARLPDIKTKDDRYEFSDGVGRMSQEVCDRLNDEIFKSSVSAPLVPPSTFQIRMGGAKGMLSLDTSLDGEQVILRDSMVKFEAAAIDGFYALEVAHFYTKPVPMFLNRPMVALLESLGVQADAFLALQRDAVQALQLATKSVNAAIALHQRNGMGRASNVEGILTALEDHGINGITQVPFLHDANMSLVGFALRNIKYRARIRVPQCHTLVGVMDETNTLAENQVVACINEPGSPMHYLKGRCLLGRSPMLAPGDLQYCKAVEPPPSHPLRAITNAIIFSQKGKRPVPSMLSGGDLDGDLFNVIQHPDLLPDFTCEAANYAKNALVQLKRPCTIDDVVDFFLDYIKMDKLGLIATRHLELSDRSKEGVLEPDCLKLAAMHSIAVDFSKSGILPEIRQMPRAPRQKPDYRKPEFRNEDRSEAAAKRHPRSKDVFYPSEKALGKMFRGIDVYKQTREWDEQSRQIEEGWEEQVWEVLSQKKRAAKWNRGLKEQRKLVDEYYSRLLVVAQEHCPEEKGQRLDEEEVFMGHVICRGPHGSRMSTFDVSNRLQDDFQTVCHDLRKRALFDVPTLANEATRVETRAVWQWVIANPGRPVAMHELRHLQTTRGDGELLAARGQLEAVLERGLAWTRAALDSERGRSAPWIILPSLLAAHACLDVFDAYTRQQGVPESKSGASSDRGASSSSSRGSESTGLSTEDSSPVRMDNK